jgi:hypothetical protein
MNSHHHAAHAPGIHRIAEGDVAAVDRCECGALNLHLGALTIRLTPQALRSLLDTLDEAATRCDPRCVISKGNA